MRRQWQLAICLFWLGFCSAEIPSVEDILRTKQYLIITQQDRSMFFETDVPHQNCPKGLVYSKRHITNQYHFGGIHLVRDQDGLRPPKVIVLRHDTTFMEVKSYPLDAHKVFEGPPGERFESIEDFEKYPERGVKNEVFIGNKALKGSVFDTKTNTMFLLFERSNYYTIDHFYIADPFTSPTLHRIRTLEGEMLKNRTEFVEDPYQEKVYYKETENNVSAYYEAPIHHLLDVIVGNYSGKLVTRSLNIGILQGATGGAFFITNSTKNSSFLIGSKNLETGVNCVPIGPPPRFHRLLVVRENDFCLLRDGNEYNKEKCEEENHEFLVAKGLVEIDESVNYEKWLLVFCIFLVLLNVLLFAYIYWLRSTFVVEDDGIRREQSETEASLFVAKHRSFPASYQEPGLLDVSVDRWN